MLLRRLYCGYPANALERKPVIMILPDRFVAHADESEERDIYLIAAYVHMANAWMSFADEWDDRCKNYEPKINFFHAIEAEAGEGEFTGVRREFRNLKVRELAEITKKWAPGSIYCWLNKADYDARYRGMVPSEYDDPYLVLFYWIINLMAAANVHFKIERPVDFIFDEKKGHEKRALNWYFGVEKLASGSMRQLLGNTPIFRTDQEVIPLQSADMLAWNLRRKLIRPNEERPIPELLDLIQPAKIAELPIDAELLQLFAKAVNESPHGEYQGDIRHKPEV